MLLLFFDLFKAMKIKQKVIALNIFALFKNIVKCISMIAAECDVSMPIFECAFALKAAADCRKKFKHKNKILIQNMDT